MKKRLSFISIVLCFLLSAVLHAEFETTPSDVKFEDAEAAKAQQIYNDQIQQAQKEYADTIERIEQDMQKKVIRILITYRQKLKKAYKKAKADKNETEANKIYDEAMRLQNEIKRIKGNTEAGLVLYMDFDEPPAENVVEDKSGRGNNGLVRGATWQKEGKLGGCYEFNANQSNQVILIKDSSSLDCKQVTLAAWIKVRKFDRLWNRIVDKNFQVGYDLCLGGFWNNRMYDGVLLMELSKINGQDSNILSRQNALKIGQWHHVAATFDGQLMKLYIDGNMAGQAERKEPIQTNDFHLTIGNETPGFVDETKEPHVFDGWIDEVRIYNRGLSEKEIKALYTYTPDIDEMTMD